MKLLSRQHLPQTLLHLKQTKPTTGTYRNRLGASEDEGFEGWKADAISNEVRYPSQHPEQEGGEIER